MTWVPTNRLVRSAQCLMVDLAEPGMVYRWVA